MTKVICPTVNCWQAFLACVMDVPLSHVGECSTKRDDWRTWTDKFLASRGCFFIETSPEQITSLPDASLIGAQVNGVSAPHIVIARVHRNEDRHAFTVEHDPACLLTKGAEITPKSVVLICKLSR